MNQKIIKLRLINSSDHKFLYQLLKNRSPKVNISHKFLPRYSEHVKFVKSKPYTKWYVIFCGNTKCGSIYLSKQNEIAMDLQKRYNTKIIKNETLKIIIEKNPRNRYLANINPKNKEHIKFFKNNNFKLVQYTYEFIN
ncbi:MAG: N-acetyltransferase [Thaumarchaeota archaeon]|nr:MAG: N-acetyltransferase [Nitrososphaerota archaeon]